MRLLETPSPTGNEGEVAVIVADLLEKAGLEVETDSAGNVIGRRGEGKDQTIILNGHMDTVPGFIDVRKDGDLVYGKGAVDMKGALAGILGAVTELKDKVLRYNLEVHFVTDEEGQSRGTWHITRENPKADLAVACEPTDFNVLLGQRGRVVINCDVLGKAGHSSKGRDEDNAVYLGCRAVNAIRKIKTKTHEELGPGKVTVTGFSSGGATNVVPALAKLTIDRRLTIGEDEDTALREVRATMNGIPSSAYFAERDTPISTPYITGENPLIRELMEIVKTKRESAYDFTPATTDASYYHRAGIPSIIFGPGDPAQAHMEDEHINIKDVVDFTDILIGFLEES